VRDEEQEQAAAHRATLERLCADGGPLTAQAENATVRNPEWFNVRLGEPRQGRRRLHNEIVARFIESRPEVRRDRKAIVLAGPPGAGKSTAQAALIEATGTLRAHWLAVNADDFKDELLLEAISDGTYLGRLVPEEVRSLEEAGEKFYPRELASLVHAESSILAKKARNEALEAGMNIVIDGTLGNEKQARILMDLLAAAGYDVLVADVETTQEISEARTVARWERGYLAAENGYAESGVDAVLGGRWVPPSFPASLYAGPGAVESVCAAVAARAAADYGCVSRYRLYRVEGRDTGPRLEAERVREQPGGVLVGKGRRTAGAVSEKQEAIDLARLSFPGPGSRMRPDAPEPSPGRGKGPVRGLDQGGGSR
jgi:predicted kinase